ncbi:MAG TPA: glycosyltransferase family 4 protein [Vicinamibacterales bacterium]|nr:glycosyltransferase family 4 protein [Vicinamibacterales bacterium]
MRLAWFSPWPPERSGIAGRSAEVVPLLRTRGHTIDVYVGETNAAAFTDPGASASRAHEFLPRHVTRPYDVVVYQLGNSWLHEFIWPYVFRFPGLSVLHDARLHHARGHASLSRRDHRAYREEFAWSERSVAADAAELAIYGYDGPWYYQWPMTRAIVEASRVTALHTKSEVTRLAAAHPDRAIEHIALGEGVASPQSPGDRAAARATLGLAPEAVAFGVFGGLNVDKRLVPILRAFAATAARVPSARLVLAGTPHGSVDVAALATALGVAGKVQVIGPLDDAGFDAAIGAVDVSLHLRFPTAREMSGPWLRALSAGRATVITDLEHLADVPALDPRSWRPLPGATSRPPIAVAIDILDEDHSLRRAMVRLATDASLRRALGAAGREYWEATHTVERMVADYERVLARAAATPAPDAALPATLRPDPFTSLDQLLAETGATCGLR